MYAPPAAVYPYIKPYRCNFRVCKPQDSSKIRQRRAARSHACQNPFLTTRMSFAHFSAFRAFQALRLLWPSTAVSACRSVSGKTIRLSHIIGICPASAVPAPQAPLAAQKSSVARPAKPGDANTVGEPAGPPTPPKGFSTNRGKRLALSPVFCLCGFAPFVTPSGPRPRCAWACPDTSWRSCPRTSWRASSPWRRRLPCRSTCRAG